MIEKLYDFSKKDTKQIEKLVDDESILINHMILPKGEGLPEATHSTYFIYDRNVINLSFP